MRMRQHRLSRLRDPTPGSPHFGHLQVQESRRS